MTRIDEFILAGLVGLALVFAAIYALLNDKRDL